MSRFHKFVDEKCMGAYTSKADNKKKRKRKGKMDEAVKVKRSKLGTLIHTAKGYLDEVEEAAHVENYKLANDILKNVGKILQDIKIGLK